jgi:hypothetical protein
LKKKGFKEKKATTIGLYDSGKSTTLESNKSHRKLRNPRWVLRSHAPVPVWEANGRAISVYEHGHDRLGEMVNTG